MRPIVIEFVAQGEVSATELSDPPQPGPLDGDPDFDGLRDGLSALPPEAGIRFELRCLPAAYEAELRLSGVSPEQLAETVWAIATGT